MHDINKQNKNYIKGILYINIQDKNYIKGITKAYFLLIYRTKTISKAYFIYIFAPLILDCMIELLIMQVHVYHLFNFRTIKCKRNLSIADIDNTKDTNIVSQNLHQIPCGNTHSNT